MKIRNGFVSNSSSSSFIIQKKYLSSEQINMIKNHIEYCQSLLNLESIRTYNDNDPYGEEDWDENSEKSEIQKILEYADIGDKWHITEYEDTIYGCTIIDNFDMYSFLEKIVKVEDEYVKWEDY